MHMMKEVEINRSDGNIQAMDELDETVTSDTYDKRDASITENTKGNTDESQHENENTTGDGALIYQQQLKQDFEAQKESILYALPSAYRNNFRSIVFCQWSSNYWPAIILSPYDVEPGPVREHWMNMFHKHQKNNRTHLKYLVYWYGVPWIERNEAYSFQSKRKLVSLQRGLELGLDQLPSSTLKKIKSNKKLTKMEQTHIEGLKAFEADRLLEPQDRIEWMTQFYEDYMYVQNTPTPHKSSDLQTKAPTLKENNHLPCKRSYPTDGMSYKSQQSNNRPCDTSAYSADRDDDDEEDVEGTFVVSVSGAEDDSLSSGDESSYPKKRKIKLRKSLERHDAVDSSSHYHHQIQNEMQANLDEARTMIDYVKSGYINKAETFSTCLQKITRQMHKVQQLSQQRDRRLHNEIHLLKRRNQENETEINRLKNQLHQQSQRMETKFGTTLQHEQSHFKQFLETQKNLIRQFENKLHSTNTHLSATTSTKPNSVSSTLDFTQTQQNQTYHENSSIPSQSTLDEVVSNQPVNYASLQQQFYFQQIQTPIHEKESLHYATKYKRRKKNSCRSS